MKVLVVDDDPCLSQFLREGLSCEGFAVDLASKGREALARAAETAYDVILLDIVMPGMDGYAVLKKLRTMGISAAILMVTCKTHERDKLQALNSGADDYLVKPILLAELIVRIRAIIRRTGQRGNQKAKTIVLRAGPLDLDPHARTVRKNSRLIRLTAS